MISPQEIFNRIQENKKKQKDLKLVIKDALKSSADLQNTAEQMEKLKEKKKQLEEAIKSDCKSELDQLDALKVDIESDIQLLTDATLSLYVKGEHVEVKDEFDNVYDPLFKVNFKKS